MTGLDDIVQKKSKTNSAFKCDACAVVVVSCQ